MGITGAKAAADWAERWREIVTRRAAAGEGGHPGEHRRSDYWDRRAPSYARITRQRHDEFLRVVEPYVSPRKTLIDAGAGAGRHAVPLAELMEWVTAVEPSEGMRAQIPHRDNMTVVASTWQDAEVAPADLFMLLIQMGIAPEVTFVRYPIINHYTNMDEALADSQMLFGAGWDEARARNLLDEMATRDGDQIVIDSGIALSGIAHWQPAT